MRVIFGEHDAGRYAALWVGHQPIGRRWDADYWSPHTLSVADCERIYQAYLMRDHALLELLITALGVG